MEFRLLRADEIDCRISTVGSWGVGLLLYKDARCDQNILDETVGPMNWQRHHTRDNANCIVSIWDKEKFQWIEKEDTGTESYTEKEKGLASDSFKRACFNWGIGRELYTAPTMFVYKKDLKKLEQDGSRWICKDRFSVVDIEYIGRKIIKVDVLNESTGAVITFGQPAEEKKKQEDAAAKTIGIVKGQALLKVLEDAGVDVDELLRQKGVTSISDLTEAQHLAIIKKVQKHESNRKA